MRNSTVNMNVKTGIRFGIIGLNEVDCEWIDECLDYIHYARCPECNEQLEDQEACKCECGAKFDEPHYLEEPDRIEFKYVEDDVVVEGFLTESNELWICKSTVVAKVGLCSPCAPNAGNLTSKNGSFLAYCLPKEFFKGEPPYEILQAKDHENK